MFDSFHAVKLEDARGRLEEAACLGGPSVDRTAVADSALDDLAAELCAISARVTIGAFQESYPISGDRLEDLDELTPLLPSQNYQAFHRWLGTPRGRREVMSMAPLLDSLISAHVDRRVHLITRAMTALGRDEAELQHRFGLGPIHSVRRRSQVPPAWSDPRSLVLLGQGEAVVYVDDALGIESLLHDALRVLAARLPEPFVPMVAPRWRQGEVTWMRCADGEAARDRDVLTAQDRVLMVLCERLPIGVIDHFEAWWHQGRLDVTFADTGVPVYEPTRRLPTAAVALGTDHIAVESLGRMGRQRPGPHVGRDRHLVTDVRERVLRAAEAHERELAEITTVAVEQRRTSRDWVRDATAYARVLETLTAPTYLDSETRRREVTKRLLTGAVTPDVLQVEVEAVCAGVVPYFTRALDGEVCVQQGRHSKPALS